MGCLEYLLVFLSFQIRQTECGPVRRFVCVECVSMGYVNFILKFWANHAIGWRKARSKVLLVSASASALA